MPKKQNQTETKMELNLKLDFTHILAALSYINVLCLIPLLLKPNDEYVRFHAKQGLLLFVVEIVGLVLTLIPVLGQLLFISFVIVSLIGVYKALQGEKWRIPILYKYSQRI